MKLDQLNRNSLAKNIMINQIYQLVLARNAYPAEEAQLQLQTEFNHDTFANFVTILKAAMSTDEFNSAIRLNGNFSIVTDQDIFYAYKFFLGRLPENTQAYDAHRHAQNTESLVEAFVSSDEFKDNSIVKSIISFRRRPSGFGNYTAKYLNTTNDTIAVVSGCQGKMLADLIQAKTGAPHIPNIYVGATNFYADFVASSGENSAHLLDGYSLIYTQKIDIYQSLKLNPKFSKRVRLLPLIEFVGFQPDQCYITHLGTGQAVLGPLGEYQSAIAASAFFAGYSIDETLTKFNDVTYQKLNFHEASRLSKEKLTSQSNTTGFPMLELFNKWNAVGNWMRTINHPKKHVLNDLVDIALAKESIPALPDVQDYVSDELATNVDWPVYPGLMGAPVSSHMRFKFPRAFSSHANAATFLDLRDFVSLTYSSLEGLKLEDVHCHQLGRIVNLAADI